MKAVLTVSVALLLAGFVFGSNRANDPVIELKITPWELKKLGKDVSLVDFHNGSVIGMKVEGSADLADNVLRLGGTKNADGTLTPSFANCEIEFEYRVEGIEGTARIGVGASDAIKTYEGKGPLSPCKDREWWKANYSFQYKSGKDPSELSFAMKRHSLSGNGIVECDGVYKMTQRDWNYLTFEVQAGTTLYLRNMKIKR